MAAFLHDTIEDTGTSAEELEQVFGSDVAALVVELTDDKSLPKAVRKELQVQEAPHKSVRAQVLKLADKISNLRSVLTSPPADWNTQRKREYFDWCRRVVDALSAPNPILKAEFDRIYAKFKRAVTPRRFSRRRSIFPELDLLREDESDRTDQSRGREVFRTVFARHNLIPLLALVVVAVLLHYFVSRLGPLQPRRRN